METKKISVFMKDFKHRWQAQEKDMPQIRIEIPHPRFPEWARGIASKCLPLDEDGKISRVTLLTYPKNYLFQYATYSIVLGGLIYISANHVIRALLYCAEMISVGDLLACLLAIFIPGWAARRIQERKKR